MTVVIAGAHVVTAGGHMATQPLAFDDGIICTPPSLQPELVIDGSDLTLAPGYVDIQINGAHGASFFADPETMWQVGAVLPRYGVTSFLPTIVSSPQDVRRRAMRSIAQRPDNYLGAAPIGLHFEGPMLSPDRVGAHDPDMVVAPTMGLIRDWNPANRVRMVTLAPEVPGALAVAATLAGRGVIVAAGHTAATAAEADQAIAAGVTTVTHLFNAMKPFGHRDPGLVGEALTRPDIAATIIVDGFHLDDQAVRLARATKRVCGGPLALISDAVAPMGLAPGDHEVIGHRAESDGLTVRRPDGSLAGSLLSLDQAVKNLISVTGCDPAEAIAAASTVPAAIVGEVRDTAPGSPADLVLLDAELAVMATICRGRVAYIADRARDRFPAAMHPEEQAVHGGRHRPPTTRGD